MNTYRFLIIIGFILFITSFSYAQTLGFDIGVAGVENFETSWNRGIQLMIPLTNKIDINISYSQWFGEDGNFEFETDSTIFDYSGLYFGNSGINTMFLFTIYKDRKVTFFIGPGIGNYQRINVSNHQKYRIYESAFSVNLIQKFHLTKRLNIYSKGTLSFANFGFEFDGIVPYGLNWAFFNLGLEYKVF